MSNAPATGIVGIINSEVMRKEFAKVVTSQKMLDRFLRLATSTINQTPRLKDCTQESIVGALLKSAQLNLEPNTILGECYIIPRQNKGKWEANFELGYKGIIKLAYRSNDVKLIQANEVFENDEFDFDLGETRLIHKPMLKGPRGKVFAYWARFILKDGTSDFKVWSVSDIEAHRDQYSKGASSDYSPWNTAFDQMAKKTVIKDVLRYAPLSVEDYAHAMGADQMVVNADVPKVSGGQSTTEMFRSLSNQIATIESSSGTQAPAEIVETITVQGKAENPDFKPTFELLQTVIKQRIDGGADPIEIEKAMGFGFNDAENQTVDALKDAVRAITKKK